MPFHDIDAEFSDGKDISRTVICLGGAWFHLDVPINGCDCRLIRICENEPVEDPNKNGDRHCVSPRF
ncbi:MAG: hypothetical protein DRQ02_01700 [Candidatus Latescibacterota bacterium]|nr:MAG: hypothetical protein DRQ02_01700 [Candidatus Latescibacterota bacterium]RKY73763.1 MAG: hypothetical protein DRQ24_01730 [Candidatus Latescibacterota bacterium]